MDSSLYQTLRTARATEVFAWRRRGRLNFRKLRARAGDSARWFPVLAEAAARGRFPYPISPARRRALECPCATHRRNVRAKKGRRKMGLRLGENEGPAASPLAW